MRRTCLLCYSCSKEPSGWSAATVKDTDCDSCDIKGVQIHDAKQIKPNAALQSPRTVPPNPNKRFNFLYIVDLDLIVMI